jgi:nicotinate dehydrogenase subunit B
MTGMEWPTVSPAAPSRRDMLKAGGLIVAFGLAGPAASALAQGAGARSLDPREVDSFLAVNADGSVTVFCGKVDLGTGLRVAIPQMAAEELGLPLARIKLVEGDTATTPDQGPTSGSNGIARGGVQIRQAAATARKALIELAAERLKLSPEELVAADGQVRPRSGAPGLSFAALVAGKRFNLKLDPKAPLKDPQTYTIVGKPLPRPDVPAKVAGNHIYVHDFRLPGMLHGRVIRPPATGATLAAVDEASIADLPGVQVVRIADFLGVVAEDEWTAVRAARALKAEWSEGTGLPDQADLVAFLRAGPVLRDETIVAREDSNAPPAEEPKSLSASYFWPNHSHGSIGPSCAVADVRPDSATIWTASQGTHRYRQAFAKFLALPPEKVRLVYLDGAGCYGMNGHEDAAADAALLSRAMGKPVRLQWTREDEHGWDPKGPPQLLDLTASVDKDGRLTAWTSEMWIPEATKGLPNIPLLAPAAAGLGQATGIATGLISQNADPPYAVDKLNVIAHWLKDTPLRPAHIRAPGKIATTFAVESFADELAAAVEQDPVEFRLSRLTERRGIEVLKRAAAMIGWQPRPSPAGGGQGEVLRGRGIAYVHYKHAETFVAIAMEVAVEAASGAIRVERVACAHDCGLIINPDGVRAQVEGCILQTLSRALMEEVKFDRARVTSVDWASYPILTFLQVPKLAIELIDRPTEPPLGAGEAASAPVAAALANAVFDATGVRLRTVPFTPDRVKGALTG